MYALPQTDRQAMDLLTEFRQTRDLEARNRVAEYVFNRWVHRAAGLFSSDPCQDRDDLQQVFFEGILRGIEILDGRGDPLFHLSQRGLWAVSSAIRTTKLRKALVNQDVSELQLSGRTEGDFGPLVIERLAAEQITMALAPTLTGNTRKAADYILSGAAGDPAELGFGQRLAKLLGVSPQRTSQILKKLRTELEALTPSS